MKVLLNKIFPKSNPFGDDVWWEILLKRADVVKCVLYAMLFKKKLAEEAAARKVRKKAIMEDLHDRMAAAALQIRWEKEDAAAGVPKPKEPQMFVVKGFSIPYYRVDSYYFWTHMKRYEQLLYKIESNPELAAFIRANWENKDEFDRWICVQETGMWLEFPDDPLEQGFSDYLSHIRTHDSIAKELIARFLGAKYYPLSFIRPELLFRAMRK